MVQVTVEELRRVPLFSGMPEEELRRVLDEGSEKWVRRGEVNGREGEPVEDFYVILEGELRITKQVNGSEVTINVYGPGMFFAEVPLLAGTPFLASGRALTDCRFFLIPDATFRRLLTNCPSFSETILEAMAQRVKILQSVTGQREHLDSLGTLAAGLAHELNNPASASLRAVNRLHDAMADQPGIPEALQGRIFEPFYTTKGVGAGARLGLDISYRIVVGRHGGDIRVVSRPGDTRFQVRVPLEGAGVGEELGAEIARGS